MDHIIWSIWFGPYCMVYFCTSLKMFYTEPWEWWWTVNNRWILDMNLLNLLLREQLYIYNKSFKYKLKCVLFHFSRATIWNGRFRDHTWICYWFDIVGSLFREPRFATWYWDEFSINLNPPIGKVVSKFINGGSPKFIWTYNWFKMDFETKPFKIENFRVFWYFTGYSRFLKQAFES